jgi:hypothetical protein
LEYDTKIEMKIKKILFSILTALVLMISIFLYMNRDKFVYVGSVDIIEVDCSKKSNLERSFRK